MTQSPSRWFLASGSIRVAFTLMGIAILGIAIDRLLFLPVWNEGPWRLLGLVPLVLGIALEAAGIHAFWRHGRGTPHPLGHPERLVTQGPYSWSRHPLYVARHFMLLGAAVLFGSLSILALTIGLFLLVHSVMIPREEARLAARFGDLYEEYRRRVSRFVTLRRRDRG